ncbi:MAG TPA: phosphoribosylanthranilate isomerase [Chthoniobacterales bacterium]|nr:phosphoribosylanthranilate isomerase [Chthoniobacterales bacterium]
MFDDEGPVARLRVKICGLTTPEDTDAAVEFGADALGFNFFPGSKRYLPIDAARDWIAALPAEIPKVGVLVNPSWEEAVRVSRLPGITALQLHGAETPDFCRRLAECGIGFAKALPVTTFDSVKNLPSFSTRTVLLDSSHAGEFGGSGRTFPWEIAREFVEANPQLRVVLAGGLTPENVVEAVAVVKPFAVDVTSGVESSAGRKDHERMRAFIVAAKSL